jgi:hypothetical protein
VKLGLSVLFPKLISEMLANFFTTASFSKATALVNNSTASLGEIPLL